MNKVLPSTEENIYPKNIENLEAILKYFFPDYEIQTDFLLESSLSINQIEFIAKMVSENIFYFNSNLGIDGLKIKNLMSYGISALSKEESSWEGSKSRKRIIEGFRDLILHQYVG